MSGWSISIAKETPAERDSNPDKREKVIACWEASLGGLDWLKDLAEKGKATLIHAGGYPTRYAGFAKDLLPVVESYGMTALWEPSLLIDRQELAACPPGQLLTIDAWDLD